MNANSLNNQVKKGSQSPDLFLDSVNYYHRYLTYQSEVIDHRSKTYNWQLLSSKITFFLVVFIVLSGLVFSAMQFYVTVQSAQRLKAPLVLNDSNIKVSGEGIEITSSILGVIILGLSIVFFFLYIKYVYPIKEEANIKLLTLPASTLTAPARDTTKRPTP